MERVHVQAVNLLKKPEDYIRPNKKLEAAWMEQTREVYNFLKEEEKCERKQRAACLDHALPCLPPDGLDAEQIWQLVELQNRSVLAATQDLEDLDQTNLCFMVARLSSLAKHNKLSLAGDWEAEDEGIGASPQQEDEDMDQEEEEGEEDNEEEEEEEEGYDVMSKEWKANEELEDDEMNDDDLLKKPHDFKDSGLNDKFGDDSDEEEDNFDELIALEGMDSDESEEGEEGNRKELARRTQHKPMVEEKKEVNETKKFAKTKVDTKFFKLRESEWVADNDAIGENYNIEDEDIDFMAEMSDGSEGEEGVMYDAFFDGAPEDADGPRKKLSEMLGELDDDEEEEEDEEEEDGDDTMNDDDVNDRQVEEEGVTALLGAPKKEGKSTFEKDRERELEVMGQLEEDNLSEKPWFLRGEVLSTHRPQNSALEEHLEYDIAARQKPVITEDTTSLVEKVILGRVRIKAWDDVERKVRPTLDPFQFKKKLLLEQEKSKKSLAEIYEEEYLKQQKEKVEGEGEEELQEHKEIKTRMEKLFMKLDALANYHYTPKQPVTDIKIQSNLPAITVEEATPATASDATMLAPQEVLEPVRGELLGKTERTTTDKKRERRVKKGHQKKRAKIQEKKLQEKVRKAGAKGGGGKLDRGSTLKVIEKAVKSGQVKLLEGGQDKVVRSSQTFFKHLEDATTTKQKTEKHKKRKKGEKMSASKLLL